MALVSRGFKRFLLLGILPLLLAGAVVAWVERHTLLCCYYVHRLEGAKGTEVDCWARKLAGLGERAVPEVLTLLAREDSAPCEGARKTICCLVKSWDHGDPRCIDLVQQMIAAFPHLSHAGQRTVLELSQEWLAMGKSCSACLVSACGRLIGEGSHPDRPDLHGLTVELALQFVGHSNQPDLLCAIRDLTRNALHSTEAATRVRAIKLAVQPGINLRKDTVSLLNDPEALVRRAAMLAVGEALDVIDTDSLLSWLHDPDAEVRSMCERFLQGEKRGLSPRYVHLGRLLTDPHWEVRLTVLDHLADVEDLDPAVWLRRLSHDPSPAVRAAAIRVAAEDSSIDLNDRLDEMAHDDPSATVAALAQHYLQSRNRPALSRHD
jgi:hypothetical protein